MGNNNNPYHPYLNKFHKESTERSLKTQEELRKSPISYEDALKQQEEMHERIQKNYPETTEYQEKTQEITNLQKANALSKTAMEMFSEEEKNLLQQITQASKNINYQSTPHKEASEAKMKSVQE